MSYEGGQTTYMKCRAASMEHGLQRSDDDLFAQILKDNLYALELLELDMRRFQKNKSLEEFRDNREILLRGQKALEGKLAGGGQ